MTQPPGDPVASAPPSSPTAPPRSDSNFVPPPRYTPETGCAASADRRGDALFASAPPAERWLLIERNTPWPRNALTALTRSTPDPGTPQAAGDHPTPETPAQQNNRGRLTAAPHANLSTPAAQSAPTTSVDTLPTEIAQLCAQLRCRPVLIRRHGRSRAGTPRRWFLVDSRPGHESIRTGELPTDEHLLAVLTGEDPGTPTTDPIYLVCTHGRHDACCAVRGRPAAAALTSAYPDRTWECSHIGGDRFAANVVFLPHSLFYGHVPADQAVALAQSYDKGVITPEYYRGSGAHPPAVQAAQHFARATGESLAINALHPTAITQLTPNHWSVTLSTADDSATHNSTPATAPAGNSTPGTAPTGDFVPNSANRADSASGDSPRSDSTRPHVPTHSRTITVEVRAEMITVDGQMTCAAKPPGQVRQFTLAAPITTQTADP